MVRAIPIRTCSAADAGKEPSVSAKHRCKSPRLTESAGQRACPAAAGSNIVEATSPCPGRRPFGPDVCLHRGISSGSSDLRTMLSKLKAAIAWQQGRVYRFDCVRVEPGRGYNPGGLLIA